MQKWFKKCSHLNEWKIKNNEKRFDHNQKFAENKIASFNLTNNYKKRTSIRKDGRKAFEEIHFCERENGERGGIERRWLWFL